MEQKAIEIDSLNPLSKDFTLVAKVLNKTDLRSILSKTSEDGLVFNLELGDSTVRFFLFSLFLFHLDFFFSNTPSVFRVASELLFSTMLPRNFTALLRLERFTPLPMSA